MNPEIIIAVIALAIGFYLVATYNNLIVLKTRIQEALSGIEVQLKRRADLIPNLIETVKGYAKHEKQVFTDVTKARTAMMNADTVTQKAEAENMLSSALKSLFAVAESYPDLKANTSFQDLQRQLEDTEDKVAYSRQFYNSNVLSYNAKIQMFPTNILAGMFGFTAFDFFEAADEDKKKVKVEF